METYLTMLYVTVEQEQALRQFFIGHGWPYYKPDLSVTTDKLGLLMPKFTCSGNVTIVNKSWTSDKESTAPYTFGSKPSPKSSKEECMESNHESTVSESANIEESVTENLGDSGKIIRRLDDDSDTDYDDLCGPDEEDDENEFTVLYKTDQTENCNKNFEENIAHGQGSTPQRRKRNQTSSGLKSPSSTFHETRSVTKAESSRKRRKVASETTFASEGGGGDVIGGTQTLSIKTAAVQEVPIVKSRGRPLSKTNRTKQITSKQKTASRNVIPVASIDMRSLPQKQKTRPKEEVLSDNEDSPFKNQARNKLWICHDCDKDFDRKYDLGIHMKEEHGVGEGVSLLKCELCDKQFVLQAVLNRHKYIKHNISIPALVKPEKKHTGKNTRFICDVCGVIFTRSDTLLNHKRFVHLGTPRVLKTDRTHTCEKCGFSFTRKSHLLEHVHVRHTDRPLPHKCDLCAQTFARPKHLEVHMNKKHFNMKPFPCKHCSKSFFSIQSRNCHVNSKICLEAEGNYTCSKCDKSFRNKMNLDMHIEAKHEGGSYTCVCGRVILWKSSITKHKRRCSVYKEKVLSGEESSACTEAVESILSDITDVSDNVGLDIPTCEMNQFVDVEHEENKILEESESIASSGQGYEMKDMLVSVSLECEENEMKEESESVGHQLVRNVKHVDTEDMSKLIIRDSVSVVPTHNESVETEYEILSDEKVESIEVLEADETCTAVICSHTTTPDEVFASQSVDFLKDNASVNGINKQGVDNVTAVAENEIEIEFQQVTEDEQDLSEQTNEPGTRLISLSNDGNPSMQHIYIVTLKK